MMGVGAILAVLLIVGVAYGLWRVGLIVHRRVAEDRTARAKWTVETRPASRPVRLSVGAQSGPDRWAVVLRRAGQEQVYREVDVGDDDELLKVRADAEGHAHVVNEGRRKD